MMYCVRTHVFMPWYVYVRLGWVFGDQYKLMRSNDQGTLAPASYVSFIHIDSITTNLRALGMPFDMDRLILPQRGFS